jgi:hypothetical protein
MASRLDFSQIRSLYIGTSSSTTVDTNNLIVTGLVGVGTTSPSSQLSGTIGISIVNATNASLGLSNGTNHWLNYLSGTTYRIWNNTSNEVVTILLNGNVGIGTTSPDEKLHVEGTIQAGDPLTDVGFISAIRRNSSSSTDNIELYQTNITEGNSAGIKFISIDNNGNKVNGLPAYIRALFVDRAAFSYNTALVFGTSNTEKMRITSAGNVGIGTTSPGAWLQVGNSSDGRTGLIVRGGDSGAGTIIADFLNSSGNSVMEIQGNGNVGIGTTSPTVKLDVVGAGIFTNTSSGISLTSKGYSETAISNIWNDSASQIEVFNTISNSGFAGAAAGIKFYMSSTGNPQAGIYGVRESTTASALTFYTQNANFSVLERLRITSAGNVGIGTTAPDSLLEVNGRVSIRGGNELYFGQSTSAIGSWTTRMYASGSTHKFNANEFIFNNEGYGSTEFMRITAAGNVGIGTTSPSVRLQVVGANSAEGQLYVGNTDVSYSAGINFTTSGANRGFVGWRHTNSTAPFNLTGIHLFNTDNSNIVFGTNNLVRAVIDTNGNLGVGNTAPASKLDVISSSTQIADFRSTVTDGLSNIRVVNDQQTTASGTSPAAIELVGKRGSSTHGRHAWIGAEGVDGTTFRTQIKFKVRPEDSPYQWSTLPTQMVIDGNGNVGIGTTIPGSRLQVTATSNSATTVDNGITILNDSGINNCLAGIRLSTYGDSDGGLYPKQFIGAIRDGDFGAGKGSIVFCNRDAADTSVVALSDEKMRILPNGNVGIGTTSPTNKLHVNGGSIFNQDGFLYMSNQFPIVWGAAVSIEGDNVAGTLTLKTESSHRIFINNVGNVGVGTTSPTNRLTVTTATNAVDVVRLNNTGGDSGSVQGVTHLAINHFNSGTNPSTRITAYQDSTSGWPGGMYFSTRSLNTDSAPVERMRITSAGNVGIGTTSPQYMLDVNGDAQINAPGTGPAYAYVPDGGFGLDSLITSGVENVALGKPDVWLRIHVDGVAFVFPGYQEP